jgi:hypothetical protein
LKFFIVTPWQIAWFSARLKSKMTSQVHGRENKKSPQGKLNPPESSYGHHNVWDLGMYGYEFRKPDLKRKKPAGTPKGKSYTLWRLHLPIFG